MQSILQAMYRDGLCRHGLRPASVSAAPGGLRVEGFRVLGLGFRLGSAGSRVWCLKVSGVQNSGLQESRVSWMIGFSRFSVDRSAPLITLNARTLRLQCDEAREI